MNEPQNPESSQLTALSEHCTNLQREISVLLGALVVASFTLTAYLGLQARRTGQELDMIRPQAMQVIQASKNEEAGIQSFLAKLEDYAKSHPDFAAILNKYNIRAVPVPASAAAAAASQKK